jgi:hypothetical protein
MDNPDRKLVPVLRSLLLIGLVSLFVPLASTGAAAAACPTQFVSSPLPPAAADEGLVSASTGGASSAWAVGVAFSRHDPVPLHWTGSAWSGEPIPGVRHAFSSLIGVAASSDTDVWATGAVTSRVSGASGASPALSPVKIFQPRRPSLSSQPLALHWDGSAWTSAAVPLPSGGTNAMLERSSALSSTDVWSVGAVRLRSRRGRTSNLIEHWGGTAWSVIPSPNVGVHVDQLVGVDAVSASEAWAVGTRGRSIGDHALIEHWNGVSWSVVPNGLHHAYLVDVSASGPTDAWAVGIKTSRNSDGPVTLHWDGAAWSRVRLPAEAAGGVLEGVSVVAPDDVYAVGSTFDPTSGAETSLILHWNGSSWTAKSAESVGDDQLVGVTTGASGVWAVGATFDSIGATGLIETPCG